MNDTRRIRFTVLAGMILVAALARLLPHPPNFTPVAAMALFGGACLPSRFAAFVVPLAAMALSDLALAVLAGDPARGFHALLPLVYASFAMNVGIGFALRGRRRAMPIATATLAGSLQFFVVTNLGVWAFGSLYPPTWDGLVACYVAAIPFFRNTLLGDALYAAVLFGGLALAERGFAVLREPPRNAGAMRAG